MKKPKPTVRARLTDRRILAMAPPARARKLYDVQVPSLGLKTLPSGRRVFFWFRSVLDLETRRPRSTWITIGPHPAIKLDAARERARQLDSQLADWRARGFPAPSPFKNAPAVLPGAVPTFEQAVEAYIRERVPNLLDPKRAENHVRSVVRHHLAGWGALPLDKITVDMVLSAKLACGEKHGAANNSVELARRIFSWAAGRRDGKLNFWKCENPAADVSLHKKQQRARFLQPSELVKFSEELKKEPNRDLRDVLTLLLSTGARKANLLSMRWSDISFETETWRVPMSKSGEGYTASLTPAALTTLERRRREIPASTPWVFPANTASGHIRDVKKRWTKFRRRCGFPDVWMHDLRRTRGSYLAIGGVSLQQIGAVLGHKSLGSTQIYARLHREAVTKALEVGDQTMQKMMRAARTRRLPAPKA